MMDWFPLLKPPDVPFRGEWTKPKAIALQPGMWRRVLNLRADEFALYVRDGISELTPSPVDASAVFLGGAALSANGKQFLLAAYAVSGATRIYAVNTAADTPFPGAKGSFHELTRESGAYGNTRFASTSAKVHFTVVRDARNQRDYVVAGNGVDLPRVWYAVVSTLEPWPGLYSFIIHDNIAWFNEDSSAFRVVAEWGVTSGQFFPMSGSVMPTHSNSGGGISGANVGTAPDNNPRLTVHPSVAPGDWAKLEFADQKSFREKQVAILWSSTLSSFWDWVKLEWSMNNVAWTTVHDGSLVGATKVQQVIEDTGKYIVTAFPVDGLPIRSEIRFLRITWMGPYKPPAAFTVDLYAFTSTGNAPGGCQHGLSLVNSGSRAESYGKVLPPATTHRFDLIGSRPLPVKVPFNEQFYYTYSIYFQNTTTTERDKGVDYVRVYRRDPGETLFTAVAPGSNEFRIALWSGGWAFRFGEAGSVRSVFDNEPATKKNPLLRLPSGFHRTIPTAFASISAANRLIVGDVTDLEERRRTDVWISEAGNPFRFSSLIGPAQLLSGLPDLAGPTRFSLFGEHVTAFAKSATSVLGSESIFVFTARSLFSLEGGDSIRMSNPRLIGPHGTISPRSVVAYEGFIYWVDDDRQLRRLGGGELSRLSAGRVEDQLRACPAIRDVAGVMFRDIFRLAHRPPGATANTRAMLYDTRTGVFMRDEPGSPCTLEQFAVMEEDAELKLFAFASNGKIYQLEDPAAAGDLGPTVAIGLDTGEFTSGGEDDLHVGPARVLVDAGTGELTVTRIGVMAGSPAGAVGTIDLSSAGARKHAQDLGPGDLIPGMTDVAIMVSVAGALPSGATLYELSLMGSARFRGYGSG